MITKLIIKKKDGSKQTYTTEEHTKKQDGKRIIIKFDRSDKENKNK